MNTKLDADDDLDIPEFDFTDALRPSRYARKPGEKSEILVDGAVEYRLRLIPSNKVLGRFSTTLDAWPAIRRAVASGRSPRTLALDAIDRDGRAWHIAAGRLLVHSAELFDGGAHPNEVRADVGRGRVAAR